MYLKHLEFESWNGMLETSANMKIPFISFKSERESI